jgi:hypothetical protein
MKEESTTVLAAATTRRTIVKTGAKIAYVAPLVAASFKLTARGAGAQTISGAVECSPVGGTCGGSPTGCNGNADCSCAATVDGTAVCFVWNLCCTDCATQCTSNAQCGDGCACIADTCLGDVCQPLCAGGDSVGGNAVGPNTP